VKFYDRDLVGSQSRPRGARLLGWRINPDYQGPELGSELKGRFEKWQRCAKCGEIQHEVMYGPMVRVRYFPRWTTVCSDCGNAVLEEVVGRIVCRVFDVWAPAGPIGNSYEARPVAFELATEGECASR